MANTVQMFQTDAHIKTLETLIRKAVALTQNDCIAKMKRIYRNKIMTWTNSCGYIFGRTTLAAKVKRNKEER